MPSWISSITFAVLVVTIPYSLIFRIMLQLPKAVALSHRRWPLAVNAGLIGAVTAYSTLFIHAAYYGRRLNPAAVLMEFVIAALAYAFGLVLLLRQFSGLYPESLVTTGRTGFSIRKTAYRNITAIEEVARAHGESHLRLKTSYGLILRLTLPSQSVPMLYERVKPQL